jgi:GxxExxY protein
MLLYKELCYRVVGAAQEVHRVLGAGFLESVYEHALARELSLLNIPFTRQAPIPVLYKDATIGEYRADFLVDGKMILEIKATSHLIPEFDAQAIHYLTATKLRLALLINFGSKSLQFKRIIK